MILVLFNDSPEARAAESLDLFAAVIHSRVPSEHSIDLHTDVRRERGFCGDCDKRVVPTRQSLCPWCGGRLHDAENIAAIRAMARRLTESA